MHPVPPVIIWDRRHINTFIMWIFPSDIFIHAKQILELKYAPHGR